MIRIAALLAALAAAAPALAANDEQPTTILRGSSAPAEPWYEPPPQPQPSPQQLQQPQPMPQQAIGHPVYQPTYYYYPVPVRQPAHWHHHFRR
jgi:hypothetical protein